jgi:Protein of unknown function (DUF2934)
MTRNLSDAKIKGRGVGSQTMDSPLDIFHNDIVKCAHQTCEQEGQPEGCDLDHWLFAEQELRRESPFLQDVALSHQTELTKQK